MLSNTAKEFRSAYTQLLIMEALALTGSEDKDTVIQQIEQSISAMPFREVMDMAIESGFIGSYDDVYKVKD